MRITPHPIVPDREWSCFEWVILLPLVPKPAEERQVSSASVTSWEYTFSSFDGRNSDGGQMMEDFLLFSSIDGGKVDGWANWWRKFGWMEEKVMDEKLMKNKISSIKWGKQQKIVHQNDLHHNKWGKGLLLPGFHFHPPLTLGNIRIQSTLGYSPYSKAQLTCQHVHFQKISVCIAHCYSFTTHLKTIARTKCRLHCKRTLPSLNLSDRNKPKSPQR